MIRRPPRSTRKESSAASDVYKRQDSDGLEHWSNILKEKTMTIEEIKNKFYKSQEFEQLDPKFNFSNEKDPPKGFFDDYPNFFQTSKTVEHPNHLNGRFKAIIESNLNIIKNSSILDIASHDGRWSFAALKNGAKSIAVSYTHLRAHETDSYLVCRLLLEKSCSRCLFL